MPWKPTLVVVALAAALTVAPAGQAKGPFVVCGSSGCSVLSDETQPMVRILGVDGSTPTLAPIAPAPYFIVRFSDFSEPLAFWIPSASVLRLVPQNGSGVWVATLSSEEALLRDRTAGIKPYPAATRASAYVDYEAVKRGNSYLRLFTIGTPVAAAPSTTKWLEVWVRGGHSPWNDGTALFWISRKGSLLKRDDGAVLKISPDVARRIRARLPLTGS